MRSPGASDFVPVDGAASRSVGSVVRVVDGSGDKFVSTVYEVKFPTGLFNRADY